MLNSHKLLILAPTRVPVSSSATFKAPPGRTVKKIVREATYPY